MEERAKTQTNQNIITETLFLIKRYVVLIISVVLFIMAIGFGYSYIRKPNYTANIRVSFSIGGNSSATINEIMTYVDTIVDFCDEGVVVDRANAYYVEWQDNYKHTLLDIKTFFDKFESVKNIATDSYNDIYNNYKKPTSSDEGTLKDVDFIKAKNISTEKVQNQNNTSWVFDIQYTETEINEAIEKVYIVVLAYKHELYSDDSTEQYFTNLNVSIDNLGIDAVKQDISRMRILLIAFIIGVILAFLLAFLLNLLDTTIKDKIELNTITGVQVVGCISYAQEVRNGKQ